MAITKAKRSVHPAQAREAARRNNHRSTKPPASKVSKSHRRASKGRKNDAKTFPGSLALNERTLPSRRFVDFPQVVGKVIKRIHLYTATDYNCITIDLQDHTTLNLEIEPGFVINAELQQIKKGDIHTLAEWPEILSQR